MASGTREIVSFQIGHYSNFVGTHWWNLQESSFVYDPKESRYPKELNHDVLFREGRNLNGDVTYTPRLLAFDLKGSLNTLRQEGVLYDIDGATGDDMIWHGDVTLHQSDTGKKNRFLKDLENFGEEEEERSHCNDDEKDDESHSSVNAPSTSKQQQQEQMPGVKFYDLDKTVNVWSDFLKIHLHPKSVAIVEQYRHGWESEPFDVFGYGQQVYRDYQTKTQLEDRMHFFLEECDNIQGMHLLVDTYDGFGGLASSIVEELADDYSNKSMVIYSVTPSSFPKDSIAKQCHRAVNSLLTYDQLLTHSSMLVPLSLASRIWLNCGPSREMPHIDYSRDLAYHTSALLASCVDSVSVPYRLYSPTTLMSHFTDSITSLGRKVLAAQCTLPIPMRRDEFFVEYLQSLGDSLPWQCLTPHCTSNAQPFHQSVVIRGIPKNRLKPASTTTDSQQDPMATCRTIEDVMQMYLCDMYSTRLHSINSTLQPLMTSAPFPHIINKSYLFSNHGNAMQVNQGSTQSISTQSIPGNVSDTVAKDVSKTVTESESEKTGSLIKDLKLSPMQNTHGSNSTNTSSAKNPRIITQTEASETPIMTALQCSPDVTNHIKALLNVCRKFNMAKFHRFMENGLEEDMYRESLEGLVRVCECYGGGEGSDESDDD